MEKNYIKWWNQLNIINKTLLFKKHIKICDDLDSSFENSLFFEDVKLIKLDYYGKIYEMVE